MRKLSSPTLFVFALTVFAAACGRSVPRAASVSANRADSRDLTLAQSSVQAAAIASAVELDRPEVLQAPRHATVTLARATEVVSAPAAAEPAPEQPVAEPVAEPAPKPTPAPAPVQVAATPASTSGSAMALEPGQTVTVLTTPVAGPSAIDRNIEMPVSDELGDGVVTGGGHCPHGGRGGRGGNGGGVIGILR